MAKRICQFLGFAFVLVGILGFIKPDLLGMHLSSIHSIIHIVTGAVALYFGFAASPNAARIFSLLFGAVYFLLGVLGFIAPDVVSSILQAHHVRGAADTLAPDNIVHLLLGAIFLAGGLIRSNSYTAAETR